ncbi:MAG TPA: glycosyltransferase [Stellaceae bacterium]|nr:glycosyltransferase [Stellaceae bacterium]
MTADDAPEVFALLDSDATIAPPTDRNSPETVCFRYRWPGGRGDAADFAPDASVSSYFLCWVPEPDKPESLGDPLTAYKFIYQILPHLQDPRYRRIGGRPILLVDRPQLLVEPRDTAKLWREVAEQAGLTGLFLGALCREPADPHAFGFDAAIAHPAAQEPADGPIFLAWNGADGGDRPAVLPTGPDRFPGGAPAGDPTWRLILAQWLRRIDSSLARHRRPVVAITHDAARGGAQLLLLRLLRAIKVRADIDLFVVVLLGGPLEADFVGLGASILVPADGEGATAEIIAGLAGRVTAPLLCNTAVSASFAAAAADAGLATILYLHEMPASIAMYVGSRRFLQNARRSRSIITVSESAREALVGAFPDLAGKIEVVRAGLPPAPAETQSDLAQRDDACLSALGIDPGRPMVLGCGALHPRKGADLFPALAELACREAGVGDAQFVWCGALQGDAYWLEYDARARGLAGRLRFIGDVPDVGPFYRAASVFVLPSREDPFPLVALEAAEAALPFVAFAGSGGAVELLDEAPELVVPYGDIAAMARQVGALLRDRRRRDELGRALRDRATRLCSWEGYVAAMLARLDAPPVVA